MCGNSLESWLRVRGKRGVLRPLYLCVVGEENQPPFRDPAFPFVRCLPLPSPPVARDLGHGAATVPASHFSIFCVL
jgi:hypothetical protein